MNSHFTDFFQFIYVYINYHPCSKERRKMPVHFLPHSLTCNPHPISLHLHFFHRCHLFHRRRLPLRVPFLHAASPHHHRCLLPLSSSLLPHQKSPFLFLSSPFSLIKWTSFSTNIASITLSFYISHILSISLKTMPIPKVSISIGRREYVDFILY